MQPKLGECFGVSDELVKIVEVDSTQEGRSLHASLWHALRTRVAKMDILLQQLLNEWEDGLLKHDIDLLRGHALHYLRAKQHALEVIDSRMAYIPTWVCRLVAVRHQNWQSVGLPTCESVT